MPGPSEQKPTGGEYIFFHGNSSRHDVRVKFEIDWMKKEIGVRFNTLRGKSTWDLHALVTLVMNMLPKYGIAVDLNEDRAKLQNTTGAWRIIGYYGNGTLPRFLWDLRESLESDGVLIEPDGYGAAKRKRQLGRVVALLRKLTMRAPSKASQTPEIAVFLHKGSNTVETASAAHRSERTTE